MRFAGTAAQQESSPQLQQPAGAPICAGGSRRLRIISSTAAHMCNSAQRSAPPLKSYIRHQYDSPICAGVSRRARSRSSSLGGLTSHGTKVRSSTTGAHWAMSTPRSRTAGALGGVSRASSTTCQDMCFVSRNVLLGMRAGVQKSRCRRHACACKHRLCAAAPCCRCARAQTQAQTRCARRSCSTINKHKAQAQQPQSHHPAPRTVLSLRTGTKPRTNTLRAPLL